MGDVAGWSHTYSAMFCICPSCHYDIHSQCSRATNMMSTHLSKHQLNNRSTKYPQLKVQCKTTGVRSSAAGINRSGEGLRVISFIIGLSGTQVTTNRVDAILACLIGNLHRPNTLSYPEARSYSDWWLSPCMAMIDLILFKAARSCVSL